MLKIPKTKKFASRAARDRDQAPPLLSLEEQADSVILEVSFPIEVDGAQLTEITIRPPTGDDILDAQAREGDSKEAQKKTLSRATGLSPQTVGDLHGRDFTRVTDIYWAFTE